MMAARNKIPPDRAARDRICSDLGTTFLVEAGAGSGKTKSLVDRMVALLATGRASIETLAAVTFTRKAAAELRGRFQVALERARLTEKDPQVRERLDAALTGLERAFIGTIHSFCARLLRERPIEAGIDPEFRELDDHEDRILLERSWDEYQAHARLENEAALRGLDEAGLAPADLETAFRAIAGFPDVEPVAGRPDPPDHEAVRGALEKLVDLASKLVPQEKPEKGRDGLQNLFVRLFRRRRNIGFADGRRLMESVELFDKNLGFMPTRWPAKDDGKRLLAAAETFRDEIARPALRVWREFRHTKALAFLRPAVGFYAERRRAEARLNFQDQLMLTARLLRDNPEVRRYFRRRFHPILVDEFQDTDPIQAEILFLLTGTSETEKDWTRLAPAPGSLFLVGDPKQSIYRFRRADIDIYNLVRDRIEASGGETLALSANFRSLGAIADWVNPLFDPGRGGVFPAAADAYQAGFMPLETVRGRGRGPLSGVRKITVPAVPYHRKEDIAGFDAARVAGFIAWALAGNLGLDDGAGGDRPAEPGDFLVLFRYKDRMSRYARRLEELGIPFEIAGSDAFAENAEIREVMNLLRALDDPDDPVASVAVLRGMFFGLSDQDLLDHRAAGGGFCFLAEAGGPAGSARIRSAFGALRAWRELVTRVPPSVALETIIQDSGLLTHLVTTEMGSSRAGNVLKLIEVLRGRESEDMTSFAAAVAFLDEWVGAMPVEEMSLAPGRRNAVRLMNLHKAKGLEAPVVWLANPAGVGGFEPDRHVRRTGQTPLGHFRFTRPVGRQTRTVSQPVNWEESAAEELKYEEAEENRLMYVAATRARDLLVVSGYAGDLKEKKAWGLLEPGLAAVEDLPDCPAGPGSPCAPPPPRKKSAVKPGEVMKGREELRRKMAGGSKASTLHETVTSLARRAGEPPEWAKGGLGLWGSEVHVMLKTLAGSWPGPGEIAGAPVAGRERLERMARDILAAAGRNPADAGALAAHVSDIVRSSFWSRAMRAGRRLFEVPFSVKVGPGEAEYGGLLEAIGPVPAAGGRPVAAAEGAPVFLSGAVDLVFREEDGWVIADYKTDRLPAALKDAKAGDREKALAVLVDHYRPQVELYTRFWARITAENVKESGLYFTALDRWVRVEFSG
ncbi:MAG: UvrD-helicase domain-containing protein [Candidatus Aminicenantes bacterium]|nr:UvrD-helicase domain-containing protein [Candidatus Aminicenantes bacterium]